MRYQLYLFVFALQHPLAHPPQALGEDFPVNVGGL